MTVFVMVTTKSSTRYTPYALSSFFAHTTYSPERDIFLLIDNDFSLTSRSFEFSDRITFIQNASPLGFSENMNQGISIALERSEDVVLLNNDIIFTEKWDISSEATDDFIRSPISSQEMTYQIGTFRCGTPIELDDYLGHEQELSTVIKFHREKKQGLMNVLTLPFFAVKIPYRVLSVTKYFDTSFGIAGGEDFDYCLRAIEAGFKVVYDLSAYIIHFGGKSSWSGNETTTQQNQREQKFKRVFREKWGGALSDVILGSNLSIISDDPILSKKAAEGDLKYVIHALKTLND